MKNTASDEERIRKIFHEELDSWIDGFGFIFSVWLSVFALGIFLGILALLFWALKIMLCRC